jgi:hypothetical protein
MPQIMSPAISAEADFCRSIGAAHLIHWRAMLAHWQADTRRGFSCLLEEVRGEIASIDVRRPEECR